MQGRFTTVTGLPGSGKSTLLASWARSGTERPGPLAWLTLDQEDNTLTRLCTHLVAALRRAGAVDQQGDFAALTESPHEVDFAPAVADAFGALQTPAVLVLDDFHELLPGPARSAMLQLIRHAPAGLHVVLASRHQPDLPLHRMRAAGELTELRSQDLAFTQAEISQLFSASGITLTADQATKVRRASGGWAMGLQLAAITRPQLPEESWSCLDGWSTVTQLCSDFLLRELLEPMRPGDQNILLRTSVLNRFTAPLVRAITGCSNASQRLRYLSTKCEVLNKVDEWSYEMNPLVRQALARELWERHGAAEVAALQQATCEWFGMHGLHHKTASVLHTTVGTHRGSRGKEARQEDNGITFCFPWHVTPEKVYEAGAGRAQTCGRRLTKSELEVLALLPGNVTLEEIAVRRHVSLNTVKTQVRSIYRKLGAGRRREAVEAARLHGLLNY